MLILIPIFLVVRLQQWEREHLLFSIWNRNYYSQDLCSWSRTRIGKPMNISHPILVKIFSAWYQIVTRNYPVCSIWAGQQGTWGWIQEDFRGVQEFGEKTSYSVKNVKVSSRQLYLWCRLTSCWAPTWKTSASRPSSLRRHAASPRRRSRASSTSPSSSRHEWKQSFRQGT